MVKQLLQAGAGVAQCALTGANALFNAATAGHTECVEVLLGAGSVVDAVTTSGSTALHSAASNGHAEVAQRLIAAGADVDVQVLFLGCRHMSAAAAAPRAGNDSCPPHITSAHVKRHHASTTCGHHITASVMLHLLELMPRECWLLHSCITDCICAGHFLQPG